MQKNYFNSCINKLSSIKCKAFEIGENVFRILTIIAAWRSASTYKYIFVISHISSSIYQLITLPRGRVHEAHAYVRVDKSTAKAFIRPGEKDCRLLVNGSPVSEEVLSSCNAPQCRCWALPYLCPSPKNVKIILLGKALFPLHRKSPKVGNST